MMRTRLVLLLLPLAVSCRGQLSTQSPIHIVPDLDWQQKYLPESSGPSFFEDGRAMRQPVTGTVAQGALKEDPQFWQGKVDPKNYVAVAPVKMTEQRLLRGQERFNIFCAPCHDKSGQGKGMVVQRGFVKPIELTSDRVRDLPDGEIFHVIGNGVRNMPSYGAQIPADDRWAIVGWVRVLGRSQVAKMDDVPEALRGTIVPEGVMP